MRRTLSNSCLISGPSGERTPRAGRSCSHIRPRRYPWLEIECSRCKTKRDVDLAALAARRRRRARLGQPIPLQHAKANPPPGGDPTAACVAVPRRLTDVQSLLDHHQAAISALFASSIGTSAISGRCLGSFLATRRPSSGPAPTAVSSTTNDLFAFLITEPNAEVGAIHPKAMPVILTPEEVETWITAPPD
jgi:hypothetical protein